MSKALVISDIHLHRWSYGSTVTKDGLNSRLALQLSYLSIVRDIAVSAGVKHVFCLGDLFHTHSTVHAEVMQVAWRFVDSLHKQGIKFHCLVGNHDMASKDGKIHTLDWLRDYGTLVDTWSIFDIEGRTITAAPYMESEETLRDVLNESGAAELFLLHQGVNLNDNQGSAWVINEIFKPEMVPAITKLVLTGHYHKPIDTDKISIVGSPMQHTWSDCDNVPRGIILLDLDTLEFERIENTYSPQFLKVKWGDAHPAANFRNKFVRITDINVKDVEMAREIIEYNGALSVEFELKNTQKKADAPAVFNSLDQIVKSYDEIVDDSRRKIGQALRNSAYETPKIPS
jgi:DNA repair exonuclease SbcCD nuclease subunit